MIESSKQTMKPQVSLRRSFRQSKFGKRASIHNVKRTRLNLQGCWPEIEYSRVIPGPNVTTRRLASISADAELRFTPHEDFDSYTLLSNEIDGIESRFDDEDYGDAIKLGIDFGTSTLKAVAQTENYQHCVAVPFRDLTGINAYLLPTVLYVRPDGSYSLEPSKQIAHSSLKLALMNDPLDHRVQGLTVAFLALTIRHIRAWLFTRFEDELADLLISWEMRIGCPSAEDQGELIHLWHDLLVRAWFLSEKSGYLTDDLIAEVMSTEVIDPDGYVSSYCRAYPEVYAAAHGYREVHPPETSYSTDIIMVDIGSGTLDISSFALCAVGRDQQKTVLPFFCQVKPLGTSKCYEMQLKYLKKILYTARSEKAFPINQRRLVYFIHMIAKEVGQALREPLKERFFDYSPGLCFTNPVNLLPTPEDEFANDVRRHLLQVRRGTKDSGKVSPEEVSKMEIILTGGGSRAKFYDYAFKFDNGTMYRSFEWLSPKHMRFHRINDIPQLRDELERPISNNDYDRLLVAYGLQIEELGESRVAPDVEPLPKRDFESNYRSKDDV